MQNILDAILFSIFGSLWLVFTTCLVLLLASAELGYRFGRRLFTTRDEARKEQIGGIQGAILGLLGLLLGFTFAMAIERFAVRQSMVLEEANAIEMTYLHAAFLPPTVQTEVETLLGRYADLRLEFYDALQDPSHVADVEGNAVLIRDQIWAKTVAASRGSEPLSPLAELFFNSLSETSRLCATRTAAVRSRVPGAVWLLVVVVSCAGCAVTGYYAGASGARSAFANWHLPLMVAVVITVLVDFSRPQDGLIGIDQSSMIALREKLHARLQSRGLSPVADPSR